MENKIKRDIEHYLNECRGVDDVHCNLWHTKIMNDIEIYHIDWKIKYNNCLLRANDCKRIGYSSIWNSFTYLPKCFVKEEACIKEAHKDLDFVKSCTDQLKQSS